MRIERATRAVAQAALDAYLLIEPARVAIEHGVGDDAAIVVRVAALEAGACNHDGRLSSVRFINHDDARLARRVAIRWHAHDGQRRGRLLPVAEQARG